MKTGPLQDPAPEVVKFESGVVSSKIPRLELIPQSTLHALARRMERGIRLKGIDGAWNALSPNFSISVEDKTFVLDRLAHCIDHCYKAIGRIVGTVEPLDIQDTEDGGDAGAILFAGALLSVYCEPERMKKRKLQSETVTDVEGRNEKHQFLGSFAYCNICSHREEHPIHLGFLRKQQESKP